MNLFHLPSSKVQYIWLKYRRSILFQHTDYLLLGLLIISVTVINIAWILHDTRPQPGVDPNNYLIKTVEFVDKLRDQGESQFWDPFFELSVGGGRPPLYQLLSVPSTI